MMIPSFKTYYPSVKYMSEEQKLFYHQLATSIENREYLNVDGNISYLFTYVYSILDKWNQTGYEWIYESLLNLAEAYYKEDKFSSYCRFWAYDCLLGLEKYEDFLFLTEPKDTFKVETHFSNTRCNVLYHIGRNANVIDLVKMYGSKTTKFIESYEGQFKDFLEQDFMENIRKNGSFFERILKERGTEEKFDYGHSLFNGTPISTPKVKFPYYCFYASSKMGKVLHQICRDAENHLRQKLSIPLVGEGWISETALFYAIKESFPQTQVIQHGRPEWLGRQHFDIWLPRWKIAIEYHGKQHFEPVEFFGGRESLKATKKRDLKKKMLCEANGVTLLIAIKETPYEDLVKEIKLLRGQSI